MEIYVTIGCGTGNTPLAAFDAALISAGIGNFNLLTLSSVIPPASTIILCDKYVADQDKYGQRLYVVMARQQEDQAGRIAVAGLGWTQNPDDGRGLFVEIHGHGVFQVHDGIKRTLKNMIDNRDIPYGAIQEKIAQIDCIDKPVCALAIAVYKSVEW